MRRALGLAFCFALVAAPAHAQPDFGYGPRWTPTDAVVVVLRIDDDAARDRAAMVTRAIATAWLPQRDVAIVPALSNGPGRDRQTAAFLECIRVERREDIPEGAARAAQCQRQYPLRSRGLPSMQVIRQGAWVRGTRVLFAQPTLGSISPLSALQRYSRSPASHSQVFVLGSGAVEGFDEGGFEYVSYVDVGAGAWPAERFGALLLETCRTAARIEPHDCVQRSRAEDLSLPLPADRALEVHLDAARPSGLRARERRDTGRGAQRTTVEGELAVLALEAWNMPSYPPRVYVRPSLDAGESTYARLEIAQGGEASATLGVLEAHAALDGHALAVGRRDQPGVFEVAIPAAEEPGPRELTAWIEGPDGRRSPIATAAIESYGDAGSLELIAGGEACVTDGECYSTPWFSLLERSEQRLVERGAHHAYLELQHRPSPLAWIALATIVLLLLFGSWLTTWMPTATRLAVQRDKEATFREASGSRWAVQPLETTEGLLEVQRIGPVAWARTTSGRLMRLRHGVLLVPHDDAPAARLLDAKTAAALETGKLEAPPLAGPPRSSFAVRTTVMLGPVGGAILVALAYPGGASVGAMSSALGVGLLVLLLLARFAAKRW